MVEPRPTVIDRIDHVEADVTDLLDQLNTTEQDMLIEALARVIDRIPYPSE